MAVGFSGLGDILRRASMPSSSPFGGIPRAGGIGFGGGFGVAGNKRGGGGGGGGSVGRGGNRGGGGDELFGQLISKSMPFLKIPENKFDVLGGGDLPERYQKNPARRLAADQLHAQVSFLMNEGGMSHGQARDTLEAFYNRAGNYKAIGQGPGRMKTGNILNQIIGQQGLGANLNPKPQQSPDKLQQQLFENVIQPYMQARYQQDMDFADQYEQSMYDKAARIKDPVRAEIAATAISNMANIMRYQAQNNLTQFQSPYGEKGTLGYLLGRQQQGMRTMLGQLQPLSQTTMDPYSVTGSDFASQVLGQQMMGTGFDQSAAAYLPGDMAEQLYGGY